MANKKTSKPSNKAGKTSKIKGRPKPSTPPAGYLASGRRYGGGGKVCK